ncbi:hypothetical protein AB4Y45_32340 [Paraburkholderia sp. EG287A]|uniref:hypothetical protein n=1 Tax=Paraburkholderia sp. EG287A TaxID=3237012 RepID=UPI0034D2B987
MLTNHSAQPVTLTYFTHALREQCLAKGTVAARMRNGNWCKVEYVEDGFRSKDDQHHWRVDGNSTAGYDFDLVEFSPVREVLDAWLPLSVDVLTQRSSKQQAALIH